MKRINFLLVIFVFGLILISGCSHATEETTSEVPASGNGGVAEKVVEVKSSGEVKEFDMIAKQWEFTPNTIEVNQGDTIKLHIKSTDVTHGFKLLEFGVDESLKPGKTVDVEFIADKTGTFTFACSVFCGSGHSGMKGQLIVN